MLVLYCGVGSLAAFATLSTPTVVAASACNARESESASVRFLFCPLTVLLASVAAALAGAAAALAGAAAALAGAAAAGAGAAAAVARRRQLRSGASFAREKVSDAMVGIRRILKEEAGLSVCKFGLMIKQGFLQQQHIASLQRSPVPLHAPSRKELQHANHSFEQL